MLIGMIPHESNALESQQTALCEGIESTSDAVICLKERLKDTESRLQKVFEATTKQKDKKAQDKLITSQKQWNEYKKQHCEWEAKNAPSPSEEHLTSMSCKTLITEQRIDVLNKQLHQDTTQPIEYGQLPRWLNVIAYDYPDVFWQYNKRIETDLNCDGSKEWIMIGTSLNRNDQKSAKKEDHKSENDLYAMDFVITIAENPKIGRPQSQLFKIPLSQTVTGAHLCNPIVQLENNQISGNKSCSSSIEISDNTCAPLHIYWNGDDYKLTQPNGDKNE